jgi:hypothetical protein
MWKPTACTGVSGFEKPIDQVSKTDQFGSVIRFLAKGTLRMRTFLDSMDAAIFQKPNVKTRIVLKLGMKGQCQVAILLKGHDTFR